MSNACGWQRMPVIYSIRNVSGSRKFGLARVSIVFLKIDFLLDQIALT